MDITLLDDMSAMDATFTMRDVIYIVTLLVSGVGAWFAMQAKITKVRTDKELSTQKVMTEIDGIKSIQDQINSEHKESTMSAKIGRSSIRHEYKEDIEKKEQILHQRIDRVRDDSLKSYEKLEKRIDDLSNKTDTSTNSILAAIGNIGR